MRVLVLGGTGTISTGVTRQLIARGDVVTLFHRDRAHELADAHHIYGDRANVDDLKRALDSGPFDAVIDMICFTRAEAELAIGVFRGTIPQYVFCSTVNVYTKAVDSYPITEDTPREPLASFAYAYNKALAELSFQEAADTGAFALTIIRPAATYLNSAVAPIGSYQLYIERLRAGLPIVLHGDGSSIWTVAHRDDVAAAFVAALGNSVAFGRAYHVTGEELLTWNSYWRILSEAAGVSDPRIVHIPTDVLAVLGPAESEWCVENFQHNNIFDNSAAARDLGYRYTTHWRDAVNRFDFDFAQPVPKRVRNGFESILDAWSSRLAEARVA